ncbi:proline-tRNA ligase [Cladochytrium replicatum]|nr:proline-tRNA ligase [Cladochytrium replicatum]
MPSTPRCHWITRNYSESAAGLYILLPRGLRVVEKIQRIIDEHMQSIDGQKLSFPRYCLLMHEKNLEVKNILQMFKPRVRKGGEFCLAPTHEEEVARLVASEVQSLRQLPLRLYQIGHKFLDELRLRSGLLRAREFIMKDMHSFDVSPKDAQQTYKEVINAYKLIFSRIGVPHVDADTGSIRGVYPTNIVSSHQVWSYVAQLSSI